MKINSNDEKLRMLISSLVKDLGSLAASYQAKANEQKRDADFIRVFTYGLGIQHAADLLAQTVEDSIEEKCDWVAMKDTLGDWYYETSCGFSFYYLIDGFLYCPYCGKRIILLEKHS